MRSISASVLLAAALSVGSASAQGSPVSGEERRFEPWGAFSRSATTAGGLVTSSYSPPYDLPPFQSSASQTLQIDPAAALGFEAGLDYFIGRHIGVRVLASYSRATVGGRNGPYSVSLNYTSFLPPDFIPRASHYESQRSWPDTVGSLRRFELGVGGVGRWRHRRLGGAVFGGLGYLRTGADAESLGYTSIHTGGRFVLFPEEYRLSFSLPDASTWGVSAGGDVDVAFTDALSVIVGYHALLGRAKPRAVELESILNLNQIGIRDSFVSIKERLQPTSTLDVTGARLVVGIKVRIPGR